MQLFKEMEGVAISRTVIQGIAQQKDYMKRLRKNGGARDPLAEVIALLSGNYDKNLIKALDFRLAPMRSLFLLKHEAKNIRNY